MIETERLVLRGWVEADKAPFHAMGNDPAVMEYLGPPLGHDDIDVMTARQNGFLADAGYCFWAVERKQDGAFLGFCGLKPGAISTPIEGRVEIGWRLAAAHWGAGYAREAAAASLAWGWANTDADAIWAMTVPANSRSWGLMERLGMQRRRDLDFNHPQPGLEERLKPHIVYTIGRPA
ncbi:GNAT family N-acetyltransferase [Sphingomonas sp. SRS2]|uniref:GNAT family N-acetyltransferase n=1 Tax=Sphingomonas sp. SRS2 TaxID=133190 RepID=UPI0006184ED5|nr:GNAT family N-acetyltransferase [Sphingomonas sp. SRS2]KKC27131.1 GCN5 family acetyltransferase [Sphingomonas sp. SRS2]